MSSLLFFASALVYANFILCYFVVLAVNLVANVQKNARKNNSYGRKKKKRNEEFFTKKNKKSENKDGKKRDRICGTNYKRVESKCSFTDFTSKQKRKNKTIPYTLVVYFSSFIEKNIF